MHSCHKISHALMKQLCPPPEQAFLLVANLYGNSRRNSAIIKVSPTSFSELHQTNNKWKANSREENLKKKKSTIKKKI